MMSVGTWEKQTLQDDAHRWRAVLNRDTGSDGTFVYAVRSTGVFCRPSCPSRRPRREQVLFFPLPEVAGQAGFRACLRCKPDQTRVPDPQLELVQRVCRQVEAGLQRGDPLRLEDLGEAVGLSPYHLQRVFKRVVGITPRQYAEACRLARLKAGLKEGETVTNALYDAGYSSSSRLYEKSDTHLGMTPASYSRGGEGARISYTVVASPLGRLLVAATERGVCAVKMGDDDGELAAILLTEYPAADIQRDDSALGEWVEAILAHLSGKQPNLDLPLDVQATAFQWRVWEELRAIPYGSTRSYTQVAEAIGQPGAARAVASACAANRAALIVPCHRVVRESGDLGGYRWGLERKRKLLEQEKAGG